MGGLGAPKPRPPAALTGAGLDALGLEMPHTERLRHTYVQDGIHRV